ncbi:MAG: Druantia anti-phage system protein DruA [Planctomycetota bacterium]
MSAEIIIQGRRIGPGEIGLVRRLLGDHPGWHRTQVSRELCNAWNWRDDSGRIKDMACRTLLLKLEARGLVNLPARRRASVNGARNRCLTHVEYSRSPVDGPLCSLLPLTIHVVDPGAEDLALFKCLVAEHHYLGLRNTVGENLKYLIRDCSGRSLCCLLFGSAAWRCKDRDRFIEWDDSARLQNLSLLTNNTRFLVLPRMVS